MKKNDALRFMIAARDNPALAAWAWVIHEYRANAASDVPPHEHWEAYCEFYNHGFVPPFEFNCSDLEGCRPPPSAVQDVLDNLKTLPPITEDPMSKAKPPIEAFSSSTAVAPRQQSEHLSSPRRMSVGDRSNPGELTAFKPQNESLPPSKRHSTLQAFQAQPSAREALPCTNPDLDAKTYRGDMDINCEMKCCGHELQLIDDGGDILGPEAVPEGEFALAEYMFHAECQFCGAMYHCSVGKPVPRDAF